MKTITIFCGSSSGTQPDFKDEAFNVGKVLASQGKEIVYGGAKIGLMGAVADGALSVGGIVKGVIPDFLSDKEIRHDNLTELIIVGTMHERKMLMHTMSDGFIALPGGYGTLEELFEILTWAQLGLHNKPIGVLNVMGYYDALSLMVNTMVENGYINGEHKELLLIHNSVEALLSKMEHFVHQPGIKWIHEDEI